MLDQEDHGRRAFVVGHSRSGEPSRKATKSSRLGRRARCRRCSRVINALTVDCLLGNENGRKRGSGPAGRARQIFERVSQLPRATQQRILANVEDTLTAYEIRKGNA